MCEVIVTRNASAGISLPSGAPLAGSRARSREPAEVVPWPPLTAPPGGAIAYRAHAGGARCRNPRVTTGSALQPADARGRGVCAPRCARASAYTRVPVPSTPQPGKAQVGGERLGAPRGCLGGWKAGVLPILGGRDEWRWAQILGRQGAEQSARITGAQEGGGGRSWTVHPKVSARVRWGGAPSCQCPAPQPACTVPPALRCPSGRAPVHSRPWYLLGALAWDGGVSLL